MNREWHLDLRNGTNLQLQFAISDKSAGGGVSRYLSSPLPTGEWKFVVGTYSGSRSNAGVSVYVDGVAVDDTNNGWGSYTAMENTGASTRLAHILNGAGTSVRHFPGKIAVGSIGPFFTPIKLSAAQVLKLYGLGKKALGLAP